MSDGILELNQEIRKLQETIGGKDGLRSDIRNLQYCLKDKKKSEEELREDLDAVVMGFSGLKQFCDGKQLTEQTEAQVMERISKEKDKVWWLVFKTIAAAGTIITIAFLFRSYFAGG